MEFNHMTMEQSIEPRATMDPMPLFEIEEKMDSEAETPESITEEMPMNLDTMVRYIHS
jgi:hypothetical protein